MGKEKRRAKRVKENFSIICKVYSKTELGGELLRLIDMSTTGLSFTAEDELSKNDILQLAFRVPPDLKLKIEIFGRVVGCEKTDEGKFATRVAFIDISQETKDILSNATT